MKILTVVGARPQFIKAAAVNRVIHQWNRKKKQIQEILVHTGQHYDILMDRVFFEELALPKPDYHLGIGSGSHGEQTGRMIERIETVLQKEKPMAVMVYGDTNSTLAGALAAVKLNIPVAHVEAGLRSYARTMPEEINRLLTDHIATLLFCPTDQAVRNLWEEGIKDGKARRVRKVGDVMYDSILHYSKLAEEKGTILKNLNLCFSAPNSGHRTQNYYLATLHRAENTDNPKRLRSILKALDELGRKIRVIFPLHPRTKKMMERYNVISKNLKIQFIEPISYLNMLKLEKNARAILTDSGGVQKEAYWFKVPCLTLRDETEWVETVQSRWNLLVGTEPERILQGIYYFEKRRPFRRGTEGFGDGRAGERIIKMLIRSLG